jgi:hypothetical protein
VGETAKKQKTREKMPLTSIQKRILEQRMKRVDVAQLRLATCRLCKRNSCVCGEIVDCPTPKPVPYEYRQPMLQFICKDCGQITLFSAKFFGLVPVA